MANVVIECEDRFAVTAFIGAKNAIREAEKKERKNTAKAILEKAMKDIDDLGIELCHQGGYYICTYEPIKMDDLRFREK